MHGVGLCWTHTLVELAIPAQRHSGLVPSVDTVNVVALDGLDLVHGHVAGKGNLAHSQGQFIVVHLTDCH